MPYTPPERRQFESDLRRVADSLYAKGDLTWAISVLMDQWAGNRDVCYDILSAAKSAAQDAADEWNVRVLRPYEDKALAKNGEVYSILERIFV